MLIVDPMKKLNKKQEFKKYKKRELNQDTLFQHDTDSVYYNYLLRMSAFQRKSYP